MFSWGWCEEGLLTLPVSKKDIKRCMSSLELVRLTSTINPYLYFICFTFTFNTLLPKMVFYASSYPVSLNSAQLLLNEIQLKSLRF